MLIVEDGVEAGVEVEDNVVGGDGELCGVEIGDDMVEGDWELGGIDFEDAVWSATLEDSKWEGVVLLGDSKWEGVVLLEGSLGWSDCILDLSTEADIGAGAKVDAVVQEAGTGAGAKVNIVMRSSCWDVSKELVFSGTKKRFWRERYMWLTVP
jgi:hypothetical protein